MRSLLDRFETPRPVSTATPLRRLYDAASVGWQDGIARLGFPQAYAELMAKAKAPPQTNRVMDVGTGTGAFATAWIAQQGTPQALTLTDLSPAMLATAAARLPATATHAVSVGEPLIDVPPQHVVLCSHVVEHLTDVPAALDWVFDQLAPSGLLVLALSRPHWCTALVRWRWGNAAFTPERAQELLHSAGFEDISVVPFSKGPPSRVSCGYLAYRPA